jgi:hypothetical protein
MLEIANFSKKYRVIFFWLFFWLKKWGALPVETHGRASPLRIAQSPDGAVYPRPGQRPGYYYTNSNRHTLYSPRVLPWSGVYRPFRAQITAVRREDAKHRVSTEGLRFGGRANVCM